MFLSRKGRERKRPISQLRGRTTPCKVRPPVVNRKARIYKPHNLSTASQKGPMSTGMRFVRTCLRTGKLNDLAFAQHETHLKYKVPRISEWCGTPSKNRTKSLTMKCLSVISPGRVRHTGHFLYLHIRVRGTYTFARSESKSNAIVQTGINSGMKVSRYWYG